MRHQHQLAPLAQLSQSCQLIAEGLQGPGLAERAALAPTRWRIGPASAACAGGLVIRPSPVARPSVQLRRFRKSAGFTAERSNIERAPKAKRAGKPPSCPPV